MDKTVLITGASSGLGRALAHSFHDRGWRVFGISRRPMPEFVLDIHADLTDGNSTRMLLEREIDKHKIDLCILNAGILGGVGKLSELHLGDIDEAMNVNCYSNKLILDYLLENCETKRFIAISSGAAIKAYEGWAPYCISKAALEMLLKSYAVEYPESQFISLAPGLVKSPMQDHIKTLDIEKLPAMKKFHDAYDEMPTPEVVAEKILTNLGVIGSVESGGRIDLRNI